MNELLSLFSELLREYWYLFFPPLLLMGLVTIFRCISDALGKEVPFDNIKISNDFKELKVERVYVSPRVHIKKKFNVCPNCNAPMENNHCDYCGSDF